VLLNNISRYVKFASPILTFAARLDGNRWRFPGVSNLEMVARGARFGVDPKMVRHLVGTNMATGMTPKT